MSSKRNRSDSGSSHTLKLNQMDHIHHAELSQSKMKERDDQILEILKSKHKTAPKEKEKRFVLANVSIYRVAKLNTADQDAFMDFVVQCWWLDEAMINKGEDDFDPATMWTPAIDIYQVESIDKDEPTYWVMQSLAEHGVVTYFQRFKVQLAVPMQLQDFPFDCQTMRMHVCSANWSLDELEFICYQTPETLEEIRQVVEVELTEWKPDGSIKAFEEQYVVICEHRHYSQVTYEIPLRRRPGFYLKKIISLVFLIGIMLCGIPFLPPEEFSDRFQITLTLLLSQIAFNFTVAESLPKVSYTTALDDYFLLNYVFLSLSAIENLAAYLVKDVSETVAKRLDYAFTAFCGGVLLFKTLLLIVRGLRSKARKPVHTPHESATAIEMTSTSH